MKFKVNWVSPKYCELSVDEITTGTLDESQVKDLSKDLAGIIEELLSVEGVL